MTIAKRGRFLYWMARELGRKYTKSLLGGIFFGALAVFTVSWLWPTIQAAYFLPVERIAIVGEYAPTELPDEILGQLSDGLTKIDPSGIPKPDLALSWEATDSGKTYIFTLDPNRTWQNGQPVTAKDVNYNIRSVVFTPLSSHKLKVTLPTAYAPFLTMVAKPLFLSGLVGMGEYKLDRMSLNGDKVTTVRFVPEKPGKPVLEYHTYLTETQALTAYKLGDVDRVNGLSGIDPALKQFPNTTIKTTPNYGRMVSVYFNLSDSLLGDKSVRQALSYAIPDLGYPRISSPISQESWAFSSTEKHYTYDAKTAGKLLAPVKSSSLSGELVITTFSQYLDIAQQISSSWNLLGIKTVVRVENSLPDKYQVLVSAHDIPTDPDQYALWHSTQTATNITGYNMPKIDKLLEDARQEPDIEKRKKFYAEFQRKFMDDIPAIPLYNPPVYTLIRRH